MSLKISKLDIHLPLDLVKACASLNDAHLCKFVATNTEGEFQHSIEVKHNQEHVISLELSNLEIGFEEGRFLAQIKQVFKVFQGPQEEEENENQKSNKKSNAARRTGSDSESDSEHSDSRSTPKRARKRLLDRDTGQASASKRSKGQTGEESISNSKENTLTLAKDEMFVEIKEELPEIEEIVTAHQNMSNISQTVPTGLYAANSSDPSQQPFVTDVYSLSGNPALSHSGSTSSPGSAGWDPTRGQGDSLAKAKNHAKGYPNRQVLSNQQAILDNQRDIQRRMETLEEYLPFGRSPAPTQYSHSSPCSTPPSPAPSFPSSPTQLPSPIVTARPMIAVSSEQLQLWKDSTGTITKLASFMVRRWYSKEEMSSSNCNGSRGKSQLDQTRLHQIRDLCFQAYGVRHRMMEEKWKVLVTAIDATCRSINRKPRRQARQ